MSKSRHVESTTADTASNSVIEAVARAEAVDPAKLPPLYDTIDPDALNSLFETPCRTGKVSFRYGGRDVTVTGDGDVVVTE